MHITEYMSKIHKETIILLAPIFLILLTNMILVALVACFMRRSKKNEKAITKKIENILEMVPLQANQNNDEENVYDLYDDEVPGPSARPTDKRARTSIPTYYVQ